MRKMICISVFMIAILMVGLTFIPKAQTSDSSKRLLSNLATVIPTIDGTNVAGEWDDAYDNTVSVDSIAGTHIHIKNTATMLYMLIVISDTTKDARDYLKFIFDEENDEAFKSFEMGGEDCKQFNSTSLSDYLIETGLIVHTDTYWGGTTDGNHGWNYVSGFWNIEFSMPISHNGDSYDVNIHSGCSMGFLLIYCDYPVGKPRYWPVGVMPTDQSTWGNICTALAYEGYIPHADDRTSWKAFLSVSNIGHATSTVVMQFEDGTIATRTIAPGSSATGFVSSFKGSDYVGPIKIWSNQSFTALLNQRNSGSTVGYTTVIQGEN